MVKIATCVNGHKVWCFHNNVKRHRLGMCKAERGVEIPPVCPRCNSRWMEVNEILNHK